MRKITITTMISIFVIIINLSYYCCITSTQFGNRPLDQARLYHNQEVIEIIEAQQQKLEGQTK